MDAAHGRDIRGVAAIAIGMCQMGDSTDNDILVTVATCLTNLGRATEEDVKLVAQAISSFPQPEDQSAEERERRRPVEEMLSVTSPEQELAALMRAREIVLRLLDHL